jgi:hypothetical protein
MTVLRGVVGNEPPNNVRLCAKWFSNIALFKIKDLRVILEKQNTILIIQKPLESKTYKRFWGIIRKSAKVVYELLKRALHAVQNLTIAENSFGGI